MFMTGVAVLTSSRLVVVVFGGRLVVVFIRGRVVVVFAGAVVVVDSSPSQVSQYEPSPLVLIEPSHVSPSET